MSTEDRQQNYLQRDSQWPGAAKPELLTCPSIVLIAPCKRRIRWERLPRQHCSSQAKEGRGGPKAILLGAFVRRSCSEFVAVGAGLKGLFSYSIIPTHPPMGSSGGFCQAAQVNGLRWWRFPKMCATGFFTGKKNLFDAIFLDSSFKLMEKKTQELLGACYHMVGAQDVQLFAKMDDRNTQIVSSHSHHVETQRAFWMASLNFSTVSLPCKPFWAPFVRC